MVSSLRFTKNELREQKNRLKQLKVYLPTLKLKKALLQAEVQLAEAELEVLKRERDYALKELLNLKSLIFVPSFIDVENFAKIIKINSTIENIAGVEIPVFISCELGKITYSLLDTPVWLDQVIEKIQIFSTSKIKYSFSEKKTKILEQELAIVSIRVNLFEKKLIPETEKNIKKISVFLSDQNLTAVGQLKIVKTKLEEKKKKLCV